MSETDCNLYQDRIRGATRSMVPHIEATLRFRLFRQPPSPEGRATTYTWLVVESNPAYPPGFWDAHDALRRGDPSGADVVIEFPEADPWFFRSGYVKATLIQRLTRLDLSPLHAARLRNVVLAAVDRRDRRELRSYRRLARKVDTPALREGLQSPLEAADPGIRRRARWILEALMPASDT